MLITVGPDLPGSQRRVGRHKIAELFDLNLQTFLFRNLLHVFHDDGMGSGIYAYDDRFGCIRFRLFRLFISTAATGQRQCQYTQGASQQDFLKMFHLLSPLSVFYHYRNNANRNSHRVPTSQT